MKISLIAAMDGKRGIGKDNKIPWYIPEDLKRFRELTAGRTVIMGRRTFESIGKPLPDRTNIIITHNSSLGTQGAVIVDSLEKAISKAKETEQNEIFIIGGGQIYTQAIGLADKLYLTLIEGYFPCDAFFPDYSEFKKVIREESGQSGEYKYKFLDLEK